MKKRKRKILRRTIVSIAMAIFIMGFMFVMSGMSGEESSKISSFIVDVLERFIPIFDGLDPLAYKGAHELLVWIVRKAAHFTEFALLGFFLASAFHTYRLPEERTAAILFRGFLFTLIIGIAYAVTDEFHQSLVNGRAAMIMDVGIDSIGVIAGALFSTLIVRKPLPPTKL